MEQARDNVRKTLDVVKTFLNQELPPRLSEADTKANFIEPIITALGWSGIGVVTREYYVKNSQEFIDYLMSGPTGPLLAIEAKALTADLTEKNAAQLIQYCSVEGIEWAALTNGRELQFFNTFLRPDLAAKRILSIDLLAYNNDAEFDALFDQIWQLSRESMTTPTGVRTWLNQRRLDTALRGILLNPGSPIIRQLRRALATSDIQATPQDLTQWFRSHLAQPMPTISAHTARAPGARSAAAPGRGDAPVSKAAESVKSSHRHGDTGESLRETLIAEVTRRWPEMHWRVKKNYTAADHEGATFLVYRIRQQWLFVGLALPDGTSHPRISPNDGQFNWSRITHVLYVRSAGDIDEELLQLIERARAHAISAPRHHAHFGVKVRDLVEAGFLSPGTALVLMSGKREVATASVTAEGGIAWEGKVYQSLSDREFARLLGPTRTSLNGWSHWAARFPHGIETLTSIRQRYIAAQSESETTVAG
jgi:hypothetical protein